MTSSTQANRGLRDVAEDQYIVIMMLSLLLLIQILSLNHETTPERRASGLSLWAPWGWISLCDGCCCPVTKHARFLWPLLSLGVCSMSTELVILSNHLILWHPPLLLPSISPSIRVFSNETALRIRWTYCAL